MPQNTLTLVGTLATEVALTETDGATVARFRLLLQSRRWDRERNTWVTSDRTYVTVVSRHRLAVNVAATLKCGDAVVVTGCLQTRRTDGQPPRTELEAQTVGPDLRRRTGSHPGAA